MKAAWAMKWESIFGRTGEGASEGSMENIRLLESHLERAGAVGRWGINGRMAPHIDIHVL